MTLPPAAHGLVWCGVGPPCTKHSATNKHHGLLRLHVATTACL